MTDNEIRQRFHRAVDTTLSGLQGDPLLGQRVILQARQKEEPKMKKKLSIGFAIVLALVLMSVTAVAAAGLWGVLDFMNQYGKTVLDGAADTVQTDIPQQGGQTAWANFTLREAVCDGWVAYLIFDVTPANEQTLLVFEDVMPDDSVRYLSSEYPEDMTIAQLAEEKGYTSIVRVNISEAPTETRLQCLSKDEKMTETGMTLIVSGPYQGGETSDVALRCIAAPFEGETDAAILTATLPVNAPLWTTASSGPVDYPQAGVRIDSVTLTGTVMGVYAEAMFTVTDQAIYDSYEGGFWLDFADEAGGELPMGAFGEGSIDILDEEAGIGCLTRDMQAMEQAPASISLYAYSAWTHASCEPVSVPLGK
ncbi:MAG: DUF4179 domain-containing protein [Christensenellaceae bacterium]|nr:DUF4179 domain-containing protein [Christensenellaceae bacterium]